MESFQISGDPNHQKILLCSYVESCHPKDQNQDALLGLQMDQFSKENHFHPINLSLYIIYTSSMILAPKTIMNSICLE